eukprot:CAMPEP_0119372258 /NCGR_PEP_ID=MMETSP1334-20130426/18272_1 /TAXON_ID=127549 /ORGANISM="Calcidiscus leptoporus, Strain RCC1130" /LENGTH=76 /DNA_ID=CAMNT_0007389701 /DNA_START=627 /DNA_END=858 /DNA_ORIENTATION=-
MMVEEVAKSKQRAPDAATEPSAPKRAGGSGRFLSRASREMLWRASARGALSFALARLIQFCSTSAMNLGPSGAFVG